MTLLLLFALAQSPGAPRPIDPPKAASPIKADTANAPNAVDWLTLALAIVGTAGAIWSVRLLSRQTTAAVLAAQASQVSADAAKTSADMTVVLNRSYVEISDVVSGDGIENGQFSFSLTVKITNFGHIPATSHRINYHWKVEDDLACAGTFSDNLIRPMPPHFPVGLPIWIQSVPAEIQSLYESAKGVRVLVWGNIEYADAFKSERRKHFSVMVVCARTVARRNWFHFPHPEGLASQSDE